MSKIQKRESELIKSASVALRFIRSSRGFGEFHGEMVAKYAEAMELEQLPNPDCYLRMKRIKQLYKELYKTENIEKFRSIIIPIERNAAA